MPDRIVWINKSPWRKPGPIVAMGVRNAAACAELGIRTTLVLATEEEPDPDRIQTDLSDFYGLESVPAQLEVLPVAGRKGLHPLRPVYRHALRVLKDALRTDQEILALTREEGFLPTLLRLRHRHADRLRVVHESHDFFADLTHIENPDWDDRRRRALARRYFPSLDGLLALTDNQAGLYARHLPACPPLLAQSLGTEHRDAVVPAENRRRARTLAYVGHLHAAKGRQTLLDAAKALSRAGIHLHLLGGSADQARRLQQRLDKRMKAEGRPLVRPFLAPEAMHRHLAAEASLGLVLLEDNFYNRHLTCPVKALDSLSHGLPVLASDLPSTRQVLAGAALYVQPGHADEFVAAASELLDSADRYHCLTEEARRRRAELLWQRRAERIVSWACPDC